MSEIVNCQYSKTIMDEPTCNAFDVNRYGEIICSEENCIILKLKEQLQAKEQECEELKKKYNCSPCGCRGREDYENLQRHYENAINTTDTFKQECQYFKTQLEYFKDMLVNSEDKLRVKEQECQQLKETLQASDIAKSVISSAEINFPIIEKLSNALDEIERIANSWYYNAWFCLNCRINMDKKLKKILDIIHKAKDNEQ